MGKKTIIKVIFLVCFVFVAAHYAHGECYNEDACFKDYVSHKGKDTVVAVNRDTNQVELFWSDKDQAWLMPEKEYRDELQKIYNRKVQLREMQSRLNDMRRETWYTTSQDSRL